MLINLERYSKGLYVDKNTIIPAFGKLTIAQHTFYTLERPWLNNKPFSSCVPCGAYALKKYQSNKFGPCWALDNHDLNVSLYDTTKRYAILIHSANRVTELQGCIALGSTLEFFNSTLFLKNSKATINSFNALLANDDSQHVLHIYD